MSWLTGLAGKAEELLNKVDQTAGASLNTSTVSEDGDSLLSRPDASLAPQRSSSLAATSRAAATPSPLSVQTRAPAVTKKAGKKSLDEELFEFLNSEPKDPKKKLVHSRQSSTASNRTADSGLHFTAPPAPPTEDANHSPTDRNSGSSACPSDYEVVDNPPMTSSYADMTASTASAQSAPASETPPSNDVKSLELENDLLKTEMQSLNNELTSLIQRARKAESDLNTHKNKNDQLTQQISRAEQSLREIRDKETDQAEALKAKDSQVAVLRVRLEELEEEVKSKTSRLEELEQDRERILRDHTDSSGLHSQALDTLKMKLAEAESKIKLDEEHSQKSQREHLDRQARLETDQQSLSETVIQLQKKLSDEKQKSEMLAQQLKHSKLNVDSVKQELSDYKEKATRILQSKDKLISSMQASGATGEFGSEISAGITAEMEQERGMLRQELQQAGSSIESLRMEVQDLETQIQANHEESREVIDNLEERLHQEQSKCTDTERELRQRDEELRYTQEQLATHKTAYQQQICERDTEIEKLRNQLMSKKLSTATESELETRLHHLTENLIEKQTLVESLSTEKNSLKLQLERAEQQVKDTEKAVAAGSSSTTAVYMGEEDTVRQRGHLPGFLKESPTDPEFTRKVKRAANTIDKFSIRLGVFLRRYPIARVFVIIYMLLLHLWTMLVLLTYQPEVHGADHMPVPLPSQPDRSLSE
ncbi:golgin subfamily A member 5-like [Watersipora subatra]|uniref:golgin subfamily A member 5-like n=1 Tax=Watersipora subatra TaxID=2589382 RepID=UPI00355C86AD